MDERAGAFDSPACCRGQLFASVTKAVEQGEVGARPGRGARHQATPCRSATEAVDQDFTSDACQAQTKLAFRAGGEWIAKDPRRNCAATAAEMRQRPYFRDYMRGR
jgi:hypothetical protein